MNGNLSYPILLAGGLLNALPAWIKHHHDAHRLVIITDEMVAKYYACALLAALQQLALDVELIAFPAGEKAKNYQTKEYIEGKMLSLGFGRDTLILALGGGVVGDMAGFVAATYMRGIPYLQIPTTLLAMVDSSIGGKTGIDTVHGKNLIGAFWQPQAVLIDTHCLQTLSAHQVTNGLIEAIKLFMISDATYFQTLQNDLDEIMLVNNDKIYQVIKAAVRIKAAIVTRDERDQQQREILNFGHTIGHALEQLSNYTLLHGQAVALGILVEAKLSVLLGLLNHDDYWIIQAFFLRLTITTRELKQFNVDDIITATKTDKKCKARHPHYILLEKLGRVYQKDNHYSHPVPDEIVKKTFLELMADE